MENIMAIASLTSATAEGVGAYNEAGGQRQQGKWARESADFNASMMELEAADAERRGLIAERGVRAKGRQIVGAQRAALAAQGVDVSTGSAVDVQADTAYQAELDAQQIKGNAWREAWGLRTSASDARSRGRMAEMGAESQAGATLLTGGLRASSGLLQAGADFRAGMKPAQTYTVNGRQVKVPMDYKMPKRISYKTGG